MATASAQRRRRERPSRVALFKACRSAQLQVAYIYSSTEGAALHGAVLPSTSAQEQAGSSAAREASGARGKRGERSCTRLIAHAAD